MTILTAKLAALSVLAVVTLAVGLLPLKLRPRGSSAKHGCLSAAAATSAVLCFGAGVLLATAFLHMLPEARQNLMAEPEPAHPNEHDAHAHAQHAHPHEHAHAHAHEEEHLHSETVFPWAELVMCAGCIGIYLVEEIGHGVIEKQKASVVPELARSFSVRGSTRGRPPQVAASSVENGEAKSTADLVQGQLLKLESWKQGMRSAVAVAALSLHALFEGLAIGLEDEVVNVWVVFVAIGAHKFIIAFSIGMQLVVAETRKALIIIYMLLFALFSPLGVLIGILVTLNAGDSAVNDQKAALGILQSLAAGTILYVAFFEIMQREKEKASGLKGYFQILFIILGFSAMALLEAFTPHSHEH